MENSQQVTCWKAKKRINVKQTLIILVIALLLLVLFLLATKKTPQYRYIEPPVQINLKTRQEIVIDSKKGPIPVTLLAEYQITGIVKNRKNYQFDMASAVSPMDLVLAWGNLNEKEIDKIISYSQYGRWYYYRVKDITIISLGEVMSQSSNTHLIPENEEVLKALRRIKKNDMVTLDGYLVSVSFESGQAPWASSITRYDTGNKSCEILLVTSVEVE